MPRRPLREFRPRIERLEAKQPLSASPAAAHAAKAQIAPQAPALTADASGGDLANNQTGMFVTNGQHPATPIPEISLDRITNPTGQNAVLRPPFGHVLVQSQVPVPGQVYNILFLSVYNGTKRTFTASDGITVRTSNSPANQYFPVLSGNQQWRPGGRIVFYLISKKYYPLTPTQSAGFQFNLVTPKATAIPGPSGIALRVRYNPATIDGILDKLVTSGRGAIGQKFGIPDTAIWWILPDSGKVVHL